MCEVVMGLGVYRLWEIQCGRNWEFMDRTVREMVWNSSQVVKIIVYGKWRCLDFYLVKWDHQVG